MIGKYVIVRSVNAGCFAGTLKEENSDQVILTKCRRLWYWSGAASLSQLAVDGTKKPDECKFPIETLEHKIKGVIEIIVVSEMAEKSIKEVPVWEM
jgi:hypothetical protein